jgi:hypothetical protein
MFHRLSLIVSRLRWKIHAFALGMTLALGAGYLGQGCAGGG